MCPQRLLDEVAQHDRPGLLEAGLPALHGHPVRVTEHRYEDRACVRVLRSSLGQSRRVNVLVALVVVYVLLANLLAFIFALGF
jgi:hypothetical protein